MGCSTRHPGTTWSPASPSRCPPLGRHHGRNAGHVPAEPSGWGSTPKPRMPARQPREGQRGQGQHSGLRPPSGTAAPPAAPGASGPRRAGSAAPRKRCSARILTPPATGAGHSSPGQGDSSAVHVPSGGHLAGGAAGARCHCSGSQKRCRGTLLTHPRSGCRKASGRAGWPGGSGWAAVAVHLTCRRGDALQWSPSGRIGVPTFFGCLAGQRFSPSRRASGRSQGRTSEMGCLATVLQPERGFRHALRGPLFLARQGVSGSRQSCADARSGRLPPAHVPRIRCAAAGVVMYGRCPHGWPDGHGCPHGCPAP